ncbi:MAG: helix-turn-helix domain-containing protein [Acidobacteriaceae bacterium]|nr:helix-turn-helix domain-containing protein [Acidobacteriaceae bacterium]
MENNIQQKQFLSVKEVVLAGYPFTESHLKKLIFERQIEFVKVGRNVRISRRTLDEWIDARRVPEKTGDAA